MQWTLRHDWHIRNADICLFLIALISLSACSPRAPEISVHDAWSFPSNQGQALQSVNVAVYATIKNQGTSEDQIIGAHSPIADTVEIHQSNIDEKGIMRMRAQSEVMIPAKEELVFKPGGHHFMLVKVNKPLDVGDTFQIRLLFAASGELDVSVIVSNR